MINKKEARLRRSLKTRHKIAELQIKKLVVYKSNNHIYAQIFDEQNAKVLVSASTCERSIGNNASDAALKKNARGVNGGNIEAAKLIGQLIATRAKEKGISQVAFDRSGYRYHGRVAALASSARENGLVF